MPSIYLLIEGQQQGPYTYEQVRQYLAQGRITSDTQAWREGLSEWGPVSGVLTMTNKAVIESKDVVQAVAPSSSDTNEVSKEVQKQIALLRDKDAKVRFYAIKALDASREEQAVEPLKACLHDPNPQVQRRAAQAIYSIAGVKVAIPIGKKRQLFSLICFILAISVPIVTYGLNAVMSQSSARYQIMGYVDVETGPHDIAAVSGPFVWRFFEWHMFGSNSIMPTKGDFIWHDMLNMPSEAIRTIRTLIDVSSPTPFHVFCLFLFVASTIRWGSFLFR